MAGLRAIGKAVGSIVMAVLAVGLMAQAAGAQEPIEGPLAPHDNVASPADIYVGRDVVDDPRWRMTRVGEESITCFDEPALWYRVRYTDGPVVLSGVDVTAAVYSATGDTVGSVAELDEVGCFDLATPTTVTSEGPLLIVIPQSDIGQTWRVRDVPPDKEAILTVSCADETTVIVAVQLFNFTDSEVTFDYTVERRTYDAQPNVVIGSQVRTVAPNSDFTVLSSSSGVGNAFFFLQGMIDGEKASDWATSTCSPDSNDEFSGAMLVPPIEAGGGFVNLPRREFHIPFGTLGVGEFGSCYTGATLWFQFEATADEMVLFGEDDVNIAVHRSPFAAPESIVDLEVIACGRANHTALEIATTPGEMLWVAVSDSLSEDVYVFERSGGVVVAAWCSGSEGLIEITVSGDGDGPATFQRSVTSIDGRVEREGPLEVIEPSRVVSRVYRERAVPDGSWLVSVERTDEPGPALVDRRVDLDCGDAGPPIVTHTVSCVGGNGRVDTTIVSPIGSDFLDPRYRVEFEGLSARERDLDFRDWWRWPVTGRPDGTYKIDVLRTITTRSFGLSRLDVVETDLVSSQVVTIDCDDEPTVSDEVTIISACRGGRGYVLAQLVNPTSQPRGYVIGFTGVPNRSQTALPFGAAVRAVTGRFNGTYDMFVRVGGTIIHTEVVTIGC